MAKGIQHFFTNLIWNNIIHSLLRSVSNPERINLLCKIKSSEVKIFYGYSI